LQAPGIEHRVHIVVREDAAENLFSQSRATMSSACMSLKLQAESIFHEVEYTDEYDPLIDPSPRVVGSGVSKKSGPLD
jgi:hypothetical protein